MVEPADGGALKAADGSDLRRFQTLSARELLKRGDRLIARLADQDVGDDVRVLDNLDLIICSSRAQIRGRQHRGRRLGSLVP